MTRRRWLLGLVFVVPLLVGAAAALAVRLRAPAYRRTPDQNVLLVTIDTLRADALGSYGGRVPTPHLDALAASGARFDFAHAHAVVTLPSHASILTGLYPYQHGIRDNSGYRLARDTTTLASLLKSAGHATGAFVSAFPLDARFGLDAGFDLYDDRVGASRGPIELSLPERRGDGTIEAATRWIAAQPRRWFAWVHLFDPHAPYAPPPPYDRTYADRPYDGEVAYTDDLVGRLMDTVRRTATRPTLVVVTADHGEGLGDHGEATHGLFAYEATLRVPLLIAQHDPRPSGVLPGFSRASKVSGVPARHIDLLPTILDALTLTPPEGLRGTSLLQASDRADAAARASYFEAMSASLNRGWAPLAGVMMGRDKFIDLPIPELYDLVTDSGETTNLVERRSDRRRTLEARLRAFDAPPPGSRELETKDTQARLRALGYVARGTPRKTRYTEEDDPKRLVDLDRAIHRGVEEMERGRPREAIDEYRQVIARRPDMGLAYRHLAAAQWSVGDAAGAIATLRAAFGAGLDDTGLRGQLGTYLAETGAARDAILLLETLDASDTDLEALNALGIAYARAGQRDRALQVFHRILEIDRRDAMAWQNIGSVRLEQGEATTARDAFLRALDIDPALAGAQTGLGVAELRAGRRDAAIAAWRRAVELDATQYDALYNLGTELIKARQPIAARPHLERFAAEAPPALYAEDIARVRRLLARYDR